MKSQGFLRQESNDQAAQSLNQAIEYMKTDEYRRTRDTENIIPTHAKNMEPKSKLTEAEDEVDQWRQARLAELRKTSRAVSEKKNFPEISEKDFFQGDLFRECGDGKVIIHLFKESFDTCKILNRLLENVSMKHHSATFVRINVEKAPFLVEKFSISVLPTLLLLRNGVCVGTIVGLDEVGGMDVNEEQLVSVIENKFD
mmetsp:Transcript_9289/g.14099  ORF Transcript_9289/g.14099 Transcript_9289/m.14099 type:complete len:199 (-) Transcript_9289:33-629(-)